MIQEMSLNPAMLVALSLIGALACSPTAVAADAVVNSVPSHQPVILEVFLDRSLLNGALQASPTDIWTDPQAHAAIAEITLQVERLWEQNGEPWAELLAHGTFLHYVALASATESQAQAIRLDVGDAAPRVLAHFKDLEFGRAANDAVPSQVIHGVVGFLSGRLFLGMSGSALYLGTRDEIGMLTPQAPANLPPCRIRIDFAPGLQMLLDHAKQSASADPHPPWIAACLPDIGTMRPQAELSCSAGPSGWTSTTEITGTGHLPLHAISAQIGKAASAHPQILLACGLDAAPAMALADLAHDVPGLSMLLGVVATQGTGDLLVQGSWSSGFIPEVSLAVLVKDPAAASRALSTACDAVSGSSVPLEQDVRGWHAPYPLGLLSATIVGNRLVIATSDVLALAVARNDNTQMQWPENDTLALRLDLPELGKRWLPFAYQLAQGRSGSLGNDPLSVLETLTWAMQQQAISIHDLAQSGFGGLFENHRLKELFPQGVEAGLSASLSVYSLDPKLARPRDPTAPPERLLLLRVQDGYRIFSPRSREEVLHSQQQVHEDLLHYTLESGPALELMPLVQVPPQATISSTWLPPLAVAISHLNPYLCDLHLRKDSLSAQDQGLPLMPMIMFVSGVIQNECISMDREMKQQRTRMIDRMNARAFAVPAAPGAPGAKVQAKPAGRADF
jgi:hypothetical protein